jgi:hypothetical protein
MIRASILGTMPMLLALTGCGGNSNTAPDGVEVSGKVVRADGSPLAGGTLILRPVGSIHGATAQIQSDGSFSLVDSAGKPSVVPGKYQVYVRFNESDKTLGSKVNKKYQDTEDGDSDVVVEIQQAKNDLLIRFYK